MHPGILELRRHGTRERFTLTYESIYQFAALRQADRERQERTALKLARKGGTE
jgi:hypothetical protein